MYKRKEENIPLNMGQKKSFLLHIFHYIIWSYNANLIYNIRNSVKTGQTKKITLWIKVLYLKNKFRFKDSFI